MSAKTFLPAAKWMFLLLVFSLGVTVAQAQGFLNFATAAGGPGGTVVAPGTNGLTNTRMSGTEFQAQLYIGPAGVLDASLLTTNGVGGSPVFFLTGPQAGFVMGGTRVISGYAAGTTITVQLRAWWTATGATSWEEPNSAFRTSLSGPGAPNLIQVTLGDGVGTTPNLVGMNSFIIPFLPEPSAWALLALGAAAFATRFRRKR